MEAKMANADNEKWAEIEEGKERPAGPIPGDTLLAGGLLAAGAALGSVNTGGDGHRRRGRV